MGRACVRGRATPSARRVAKAFHTARRPGRDNPWPSSDSIQAMSIVGLRRRKVRECQPRRACEISFAIVRILCQCALDELQAIFQRTSKRDCRSWVTSYSARKSRPRPARCTPPQNSHRARPRVAAVRLPAARRPRGPPRAAYAPVGRRGRHPGSPCPGPFMRASASRPASVRVRALPGPRSRPARRKCRWAAGQSASTTRPHRSGHRSVA